MKAGQIHHLEYYVQDLEASNQLWDWLMPQLGYESYQSWDRGKSWKHSIGTYIVFVEIDSVLRNSRQGPGLNHLAFHGRDRLQLDTIREELLKRGFKILDESDGYLCFEDPNRFAIEIYAE